MANAPVIFWLRRDFRLGDHPGLTEAAATGRPVIPVFILDEVVETHGAAPKWRLGLVVEHFTEQLEKIGSRLIIRQGKALEVLRDLIKETGAEAVYWTRAYDPDAVARDKDVKSALKDDGLEAESHPGHVLFEPWTVETKSGGFYKVYTPMWKAVRDRDIAECLPAITELQPPDTWPDSEDLADLKMGDAMRRGADIVKKHVSVGESAAVGRLGSFIANGIESYKDKRDLPSGNGTSRLSENLTYGEISARRCWHAGWRAVQEGKRGAETFLKELVWREFAYHLVYHTPEIVSENWNGDWDGFPWKDDRKDALRWKQGRTGIEMVDAAMREMYVTGTMHNRSRMIVASYLTKHMMTHWKVGKAWFEDCLIDWDPASNALGWQWVAGCGPDAAPYFRVFNPETQGDKFDSDGDYRNRFIAEGRSQPAQDALDYFEAIPESWGLSPEDDYPSPVVGLREGREAALDAYSGFKDDD
ncbi:cryptochrome/photolyase family protein [Amaricoccus tamworthensis]|uniref:cryptochrome/photolyase family protein n=1 Tax=Amaricoccus tamworthensis TaxID=57002 RepID=UPI003C7AF607